MPYKLLFPRHTGHHCVLPVATMQITRTVRHVNVIPSGKRVCGILCIEDCLICVLVNSCQNDRLQSLAAVRCDIQGSS